MAAFSKLPESSDAMRGTVRPQLDTIDLLKALAVQLIILHHLAFYGPMADYARPLASSVIDWLGQDARIAVQIFLVVAGFLAAKSLAPLARPAIEAPLRAIGYRYLRLVPPFTVAVLLAVVASGWAGRWMTHASISPMPSWSQLLAHVFLLQGVLGMEGLTAGAWYVAIDFQLYALFVGLGWLCAAPAESRRQGWLLPLAVCAGVTVALLYFNRDPGWDNWALYFFGSYGLGALAWWAGDPARSKKGALLLLLAMLLPALLALSVEYRIRLVVALLTATLLVACGRAALPLGTRTLKLINGMGRISYAVFLIHFPVCLLVNAAFFHFAPAQPVPQAIGVLSAWGASLAAGIMFYRWVELPLGTMWSPASRQARARQGLQARQQATELGGWLLSKLPGRLKDHG